MNVKNQLEKEPFVYTRQEKMFVNVLWLNVWIETYF